MRNKTTVGTIKPSKLAAYVKVLTGLVLMAYVIYRIYACAMAGVRLDPISFMACSAVIVIAGFAAAALCECFTNKMRYESIPRVIMKQAIEAAVIVAGIVIVCLAVYAIK